MSSDNKNNNNGAQNTDEVASILKRLSELLDNSVSLDDAIALVKKQKEEEAANAPEAAPSVTENKKKAPKDNGQLSFDLTADDTDTDNNTQAEIQVEEIAVTEEPAVVVEEQTEEAPVAEEPAIVAEEQTEEVPVAEEPAVVAEEQAEEAPAAEEPAVVVEEQIEEIIAVSEPEDVVIVETAEESVEEETTEENTVTEALKEAGTADNTEPKAVLSDLDEMVKAVKKAIGATSEDEEAAESREAEVEIIAVEETVADPVPAAEETAVTEEPEETKEINETEESEEAPVSEENGDISVSDVADADTETVITEDTETVVTEDTDSHSDEHTEEAEQAETSKIFDELMACFDDKKAISALSQEDTEGSPVETPAVEPAEETDETTAEETATVSEEDGETAYEPVETEEGQGGDSAFVPVEHDVDKEDDELFSAIFSEERSERKNRENDKKRWQKQNDNGTAFISGIFDWLEVVVLSAAFALLLFTFILRLAVVDGDSMNHTLHDRELLIISDLMYTPENNDIIVFNSPNYPEPIVKRVIATEGQTVDIDFETWTVTVDGVALDEDYVNKVYGSMDKSDTEFPLTVPEGHVFVMGDNRNESLDSRNSRIGFVDVRYILGEVKLRLFPFNRFGKVN